MIDVDHDAVLAVDRYIVMVYGAVACQDIFTAGCRRLRRSCCVAKDVVVMLLKY